MPDIFGYVYLITDNSNGKMYVGQTTNTIEGRFYTHVKNALSFNSNTVFAQAIRACDGKGLTLVELARAYSRNELNLLEEFYVKECGTLEPLGYNSRGGGNSAASSAEYKRRMSESLKAAFASPKAKKRLSDSLSRLKYAHEGKLLSAWDIFCLVKHESQVDYGVFATRLHSGWSVGKALGPKTFEIKFRKFEFEGKMQSPVEIYRSLGNPEKPGYRLFANRLFRGLSVEDSANPVVRKLSKSKSKLCPA